MPLIFPLILIFQIAMTPDPERIQITPASDLGIFWALVRPFLATAVLQLILHMDTRLKCIVIL